ncbi:MAG: hypothetical protein CSA96_01175, partial [Bacteroidetes bacterium]
MIKKKRGAGRLYKWGFFVTGIASTIWFLVRVIPKPSRASYPCMRAAAPFMSSFIIYLLGISGTAALFKGGGRLLKKSRYVLGALVFISALVVFAFISKLNSDRLFAGNTTFEYADESDFPPNQPMGKELGIFPGRVVWEWDPDATNENCANEARDWVDPDAYFMAKNNNQAVIGRMMNNIILKLSGSYNPTEGWDKIFSDFNERKGRGSSGYQDGQTLFIKINQGGAGWLTNSDDLGYSQQNWVKNYYPNIETSGPMALALLDQLINKYGIPQEKIYIGDPNAHILKDNYDLMAAHFPNVNYMDKDHSDLGRTKINKTSDPVFSWSDPSSISAPEETRYSWDEVVNADYIINLATLKAHARAGVSLTAKNHFGTHANQDGAWPLHNGLVCYVGNDVLDPIRNQYGEYRVLTDIMGHEKLGGNTVLFIVEGLWGGPEAVSKPVKWQSAPFNNDWPSSILASQDAVALESVCFDLLRTEWGDPASAGIGRPLYGAVDDHLHQAADSANWPSGIIYDPEGDGTPMSSMGVHEHWNNARDRQYSRNLGYDYGIELIADKSLVQNAVNVIEAKTPPIIDGEQDDECWEAAQWYNIDQTWIRYGEEVDSADFFGRFKMSWSSTENLLYFLLEVTDDVFIDGYIEGEEGYQNYDIPEVFIDEDASGGLHALDNDATWGLNSENAFSYHLNVNAPAEGQSTSDFVAMDLDGEWARINYASHFPELRMKKTGKQYCYEFALKVYNDSYEHSNPEASRVQLTGNKEIGFTMAWCDNDEDSGEILRDHFFASTWVARADSNSHWINADGFGRARLIERGNSTNQAVELIGSIPDFIINAVNVEYVLCDDLNTIFKDPNGRPLSYTLSCDRSELDFSITESTLKVKALSSFGEQATVTVEADNGISTATAAFQVSFEPLGLGNRTQREALLCFPNPVSDQLNIEMNLESAYTGLAEIEVFTLNGMLIQQQNGLILIAGKGN